MNTTSRPHWRQLFRAFANRGLPPPAIALETNSQALRIRAIASSDYLGIGSRQFLRQQARQFALVELPMKEMTHVRHVSVIYRKDGYLSPAARRLIEILKAKAKESLARTLGTKPRAEDVGAAEVKVRMFLLMMASSPIARTVFLSVNRGWITPQRTAFQ